MKAVCVLRGEKVTGTVQFSQESADAPVTVEGNVAGLSEGFHGFHVHEFGDNTNGCISAGAHFNPLGKTHGGPKDENRHIGDLGNIEAGSDGASKFTLTDKQISLFGSNTILGRTIVVHADQDDFGKGGFDDSLTTGHAGARVSCGVIGIAKI
eukprot:TRINITY_DN12352_c0_g1_i1.p1 TRINITY_DN12352_c0_g1~~TRINITY_DN12352_c0_g1_i1.p1  ORF type:complete len:153 (-),score=70.78 TRINITY_DN12352_c0_g1_i1:139-597(-)